MDSTTMRRTQTGNTPQEAAKEIAQGHAQDDHEEEQTWQQTM